MEKAYSFRLALFVLFLLAITLACDLSGTTVDCNVPDLIASINNANSNPAPSTLDLDPGCVYTLTAVDNSATSTFNGSVFEYGDNGLPQITTPITINGNNATITRAGSAPHFRFFFVTDEGSLTINDLTLSNGFADGTYPGGGSAFPGSGGAIYNDGCYVEANNTVMLENEATFHGGAVFAIRNNTETYLNDSMIMENTAPHGGGIFIYTANGVLSVVNSEISENIATTKGGGISVDYGAELIITDSVISNNQSNRRGGGIFKDGSADSLPTTITNTVIEGNSAVWSGGGAFIWRTPLTISDSQFINNYAEEYGGGLGYQSNSTQTIVVSNTVFEGNSATLDGGAILFTGELMNISNCTIQDNYAVNGAGIFNGSVDDTKYISRPDSSLTITGGVVEENIATENGGGAFNKGTMTCGESNFVGNEASLLGGGIQNVGELESLGCGFEKNTSGDFGGGINNDNIADIRSSTFNKNESMRGGGLAVSGGNTDISDTDFTDNTVTGDGGGIYNSGAMKVQLSLFSGNEAATLGGGIHNLDEITVIDCTFARNLAAADGGGLNTYAKASISGSTFVGNTGFRGGGMASVGGDSQLLNSTFSANSAIDSGGGIYNMGPLIGDTTPGGVMQVNHVTIAYNNAPAGGGIATSGGGLSIKNSIVALNTSGSDCLTSSVDFLVYGENIQTDGTCPGFTIKEDPLLKTLANYGGPTDTHALQSDSPAIDAAPDCTTVGGSIMTVDQRGIARPGGPICDIGAFEDEIGGPLPGIEPCTFTAITNLNCRLGPDDRLYPVIDSFKSGQSAPVVGRSWDKVFAYVEGPINGEVCAVPATVKFGKLTGNCEDLEVIDPPDVDETVDEDEPVGCTIKDQSGALVCVVPCPDGAKPGDPCTP